MCACKEIPILYLGTGGRHLGRHKNWKNGAKVWKRLVCRRRHTHSLSNWPLKLPETCAPQGLENFKTIQHIQEPTQNSFEIFPAQRLKFWTDRLSYPKQQGSLKKKKHKYVCVWNWATLQSCQFRLKVVSLCLQLIIMWGSLKHYIAASVCSGVLIENFIVGMFLLLLNNLQFIFF